MAIDSEYVICPHCGEEHGDAWESTNDSVRPFLCQNPDCGETFMAWAEYDILYHSRKVVRDDKSA